MSYGTGAGVLCVGADFGVRHMGLRSEQCNRMSFNVRVGARERGSRARKGGAVTSAKGEHSPGQNKALGSGQLEGWASHPSEQDKRVVEFVQAWSPGAEEQAS